MYLQFEELFAVAGRQVDEDVLSRLQTTIDRAVPLHRLMSVRRVSHTVDVLTNNDAFVYHRIHQLLQPLQTYTVHRKNVKTQSDQRVDRYNKTKCSLKIKYISKEFYLSKNYESVLISIFKY